MAQWNRATAIKAKSESVLSQDRRTRPRQSQTIGTNERPAVLGRSPSSSFQPGFRHPILKISRDINPANHANQNICLDRNRGNWAINRFNSVLGACSIYRSPMNVPP